MLISSFKHCFTALAFVISLTTASLVCAQALPQAVQSGNISYITGGIGGEERAALEAVRSDYNLHIMSAKTSGEFAGDTHITILDKKGNILAESDAGPLFYAKLPTGTYTVKASSADQTKQQKITISGSKSSHIHFSWK